MKIDEETRRKILYMTDGKPQLLPFFHELTRYKDFKKIVSYLYITGDDILKMVEHYQWSTLTLVKDVIRLAGQKRENIKIIHGVDYS